MRGMTRTVRRGGLIRAIIEYLRRKLGEVAPGWQRPIAS